MKCAMSGDDHFQTLIVSVINATTLAEKSCYPNVNADNLSLLSDFFNQQSVILLVVWFSRKIALAYCRYCSANLIIYLSLSLSLCKPAAEDFDFSLNIDTLNTTNNWEIKNVLNKYVSILIFFCIKKLEKFVVS